MSAGRKFRVARTDGFIFAYFDTRAAAEAYRHQLAATKLASLSETMVVRVGAP